MSILDPSTEPPRLADFWAAVKMRLLESELLAEVLGGADRVYFAPDDDTSVSPVAEESKHRLAWGRVVIVAATPIVNNEDGLRMRVPTVLVRTEGNRPSREYDPGIMLEAAQGAVFRQLEGWRPTGLRHGTARMGCYLSRPSQSAPLWDGEAGLWFLSAEYRCVIGPAQ